MSWLWDAFARPLLFRIDPESAHHIAGLALDQAERHERLRGVAETLCGGSDGGLGLTALGLSFANPVGIAGGFDKDGRWIRALGALGFGHVEVGTVTPLAQVGNARPRIFRVPSQRALVNRMGFPSDGAAAVASRLASRAHGGPPILASLGKNKDTPAEAAAADYVRCLQAVHGVADAFTVNVSSPNTPGLRDLGVGRSLDGILDRVLAEGRRLATEAGASARPVLVKLSPDLADDDLKDVVERSLRHGVAGFVAVNTTIGRESLERGAGGSYPSGGLSGAPLKARARDAVRRVRRSAGRDAVIVGVGGIFTGDDALALIRAGATLVQAYTGFIYRGPAFAARVKDELRAALARAGLGSVTEAVGIDA